MLSSQISRPPSAYPDPVDYDEATVRHRGLQISSDTFGRWNEWKKTNKTWKWDDRATGVELLVELQHHWTRLNCRWHVCLGTCPRWLQTRPIDVPGEEVVKGTTWKSWAFVKPVFGCYCSDLLFSNWIKTYKKHIKTHVRDDSVLFLGASSKSKISWSSPEPGFDVVAGTLEARFETNTSVHWWTPLMKSGRSWGRSLPFGDLLGSKKLRLTTILTHDFYDTMQYQCIWLVILSHIMYKQSISYQCHTQFYIYIYICIMYITFQIIFIHFLYMFNMII